MIGRSLTITRRSGRTAKPGPVMLDVAELVAPPEVSGMSVRVRAGEVVGLAGLVGSGRTGFAEALFGIHRPASGTVTVNGRNITGASPRRCIDAGLIYLAEDRGRNGIFAEVDIARNATSAIVRQLPRAAGSFIRPRKELQIARTAALEMDVRASSVAAGSLGTFTVTNSPAAGTIIFSKPLEFTRRTTSSTTSSRKNRGPGGAGHHALGRRSAGQPPRPALRPHRLFAGHTRRWCRAVSGPDATWS